MRSGARTDGTSSRQLLVAGHVNLDRFLQVERLPTPDRTVPIREEETRLGGPAATIARVAARAGLSVGLLARIGAEFPPAFVQRLRSDGIDVRGLEQVPGARSPTCYILEDPEGRQMTAIDPGPMRAWRGAQFPEPLLRDYSWLHLVTGAPGFQLALLDKARRLGLRVGVDPAQEVHYLWKAADLGRLLRPAEILFANRSELAQILKLRRRTSVRSLLEEVPLVVVTLGGSGAAAYSRSGTERVRAIPVRRPRTLIGAGDAFRGGFYGAWFGGEPLRNCLKSGVDAATRWMRSEDPTPRIPPAADPGAR